MKAKIIKIGNSQGIRIPKIILEQSGFGEEVELEVSNRQLILRPARHIRQGWENEFQAMAEKKDDRLLDEEYLANQSSWDTDEWEWIKYERSINPG